MNKSKIAIFIVIAILLLLIAIIFLFVTKNQKESISVDTVQLNQKALTIDEFKAKMQEYNYVAGGTMKYSDSESGCSAYDQSGTIEFNFSKYSDEKGAKETFDFSKSVWANIDGKVEINKSSKYAVTKDNTYLIVSRVGDTVLSTSVDTQYKEKINEIFNNLGY